MEARISAEERLALQRRSKRIVTIATLGLIFNNIMSVGDLSLLWILLMWLVWVALLGLYIWGCADLARSKGYPWPFAFLGLVSLIGYLVVYCLPDRWLADKYRPSTSKVEESNYTRDPNRI
jgi:hypothetical protein